MLGVIHCHIEHGRRIHDRRHDLERGHINFDGWRQVTRKTANFERVHRQVEQEVREPGVPPERGVDTHRDAGEQRKEGGHQRQFERRRQALDEER